MAEAYLKRIIKPAEGNTVNGTSTLSGTYQETIAANDPVYMISAAPDWNGTKTKLPDLTDLPPSYLPGLDWSVDGVYVATLAVASPWMTIYKRSEDTFTKLTVDTTGISKNAGVIRFSPNGTYLAAACSSPRGTLNPNPNSALIIYKRSGDTFTKLNLFSNFRATYVYPTQIYYTCSNLAWSSDSTYLAVQMYKGQTVISSTSTWNYLYVYKRTGDGFSLIYTYTYPTGQAAGKLRWSPDDSVLLAGVNVSPWMEIFTRSGDTITKSTATISSLPSAPTGIDYSPDGVHCSVSHTTTPFITIYKLTGSTSFSKLANPATLPPGAGYAVDWSSNGQYMAVNTATTPFVMIYERDGDTFTKLSDPGTLPGGLCYNGLNFDTSTGRYLITAENATPFINIYKIDPGVNSIFKSGNDFVDITTNIDTINGIGYANQSGVLNDIKTIKTIWKEVV